MVRLSLSHTHQTLLEMSPVLFVLSLSGMRLPPPTKLPAIPVHFTSLGWLTGGGGGGIVADVTVCEILHRGVSLLTQSRVGARKSILPPLWLDPENAVQVSSQGHGPSEATTGHIKWLRE